MRLTSFSVTNYRSIRDINEFPVDIETILIGKNNEGKSNVLKALDMAMNTINKYSFASRRRIGRISEYLWEEDFPIELQKSQENGKTIIVLEFKFNDKEIKEFYEEIGSKINGKIKIEVSYDKDSFFNTRIIKKGNQKIISDRKKEIIGFIAERISFVYIPTIRTETDFIKTIEQLIDNTIRSLKENDEYNKAIELIVKIQEKAINSLRPSLEKQLSEFLPKIEEVDFDLRINYSRARITRRSADVIINDGTATSIRNKGDGVKSLAAIAILRSNANSDYPTIIALEEPESHLHPEAMNQLRDTLHTLSQTNQIILSTHNPLFAARDNIKANIIVDSGKAIPAKKIKEVREILGVRISDNLINAENLLVVEGENDKIVLMKILPSLSEKVGRALNNGTFGIEHLGGTGNLSYKLAEISNYITKFHVLLDYDKAGIESYEKAESRKLINRTNLTYIRHSGLDESEFEDCLNVDIYKEDIERKYRIKINCINPEYKNKKWSDRIGNAFVNHTYDWDENIKKEIKLSVANKVPNDASVALHTHKRAPIDALVTAIESMLAE